MALEQLSDGPLSWRWTAAAALFLLAFVGMLSGVSLSERPGVVESGVLTKAYYSLGLFVVGGLDVGTPVGGPLAGRVMLWVAYFGAPLLTASAVIEAVIRVMSPHRWQLRRLRDHVVVAGSGDLTTSYLRVLRRRAPNVPVVVVDHTIDYVRQQELQQTFKVTTVVGDITHDFLIRYLRIRKAVRVVLFGADDFQTYEAAGSILRQYPKLASKLILHCNNLRFLRAMQDTRVAANCFCFNSYHLAATSLVNEYLLAHFAATVQKDVVVLAGFGRFGQTILEELNNHAGDQLETVAVIDLDADRRVLVAEEQKRIGSSYRREIFEGDIRHPEVWQKLADSIDLSTGEPTIILGTGQVDENLRAALWLKQRYPHAMVMTRTNDKSDLAMEVGAEHNLIAFSIKQLVEDNIPQVYLI